MTVCMYRDIHTTTLYYHSVLSVGDTLTADYKKNMST